MVNKQIFAAIFWSNKTETFIRIEPLNCTFAHFLYSFLSVKNKTYVRIHLFEHKIVTSDENTRSQCYNAASPREYGPNDYKVLVRPLCVNSALYDTYSCLFPLSLLIVSVDQLLRSTDRNFLRCLRCLSALRE